jgi:hypothetical protein
MRRFFLGRDRGCGLFTFSGTVGTGKTSAAAAAVSILNERGVVGSYEGFGHLRCFPLKAKPRVRDCQGKRILTDGPPPVDVTPQVLPKRREIFRQRDLPVALALGYLGRIIAFRIYRRWYSGKADAMVLDRYFYDSLAHFHRDSTWNHRMLRVLEYCVPKPDAAFLLFVDCDQILRRRPGYSEESIRNSISAYRAIARDVPHMIVIEGDGFREVNDRIADIIGAVAARHLGACERQALSWRKC